MSTVPRSPALPYTIYEHVRPWGNGFRLLGYVVGFNSDPVFGNQVFGCVRFSDFGRRRNPQHERHMLRVAKILAKRGPDALDDDGGSVCYHAISLRTASMCRRGGLLDHCETSRMIALRNGASRRRNVASMRLISLGEQRSRRNIRRPELGKLETCSETAWKRFCLAALAARNAAAPARVYGCRAGRLVA